MPFSPSFPHRHRVLHSKSAERAFHFCCAGSVPAGSEAGGKKGNANGSPNKGSQAITWKAPATGSTSRRGRKLLLCPALIVTRRAKTLRSAVRLGRTAETREARPKERGVR
uniref:Uncharacterized protein n=1 Tax=Photobacterium gaetbulicola Gung47 TaxID=658445 RepID=A0A0C4JN15_9GAMM|nr:hypothetical protein H744_p0065 [Photobacterium gaetbulicola Gung47]